MGWFGLTFGTAGLVWIVLAIVGGPDYDAGDLAYFLGYLASVAGVVIGTLVARAVRVVRER